MVSPEAYEEQRTDKGKGLSAKLAFCCASCGPGVRDPDDLI